MERNTDNPKPVWVLRFNEALNDVCVSQNLVLTMQVWTSFIVPRWEYVLVHAEVWSDSFLYHDFWI